MDESWFDRRTFLQVAGTGVLGGAGSSQAVGEPATDTDDAEDREATLQSSSTDVITGALTTDSQYDTARNGYYETHTFQASAGDEMAFELRPDTVDGVADTQHAPKLELVDPDGQSVVSAGTATEPNYGAVSLGARELTKDGTYTVYVTTTDYTEAAPYDTESEAYNDTFGYELRLHGFYGAADLLSYDSSAVGTLDEGSNFGRGRNGRYDVYEFDAQAGDKASFELRPDTGVADTDHAPKLELVDPDGQFVVSAITAVSPNYGAVSLSTRELTKDGTYTLIVTTTDSGDADPYTDTADTYFDSFGYELRVHEFYGAADGSLSYDSSTTGQLDGTSKYNRGRNGRYDLYEFDAQAGDKISFELRPDTDAGVAETGHAPELELWDPDGQFIVDATTATEPNYGAVSLSVRELLKSGTYTLIVTTSDPRDADPYTDTTDTYFDSFGYELRVHEFYGAADGSLSYDSSTTGQLDEASNYNRSRNGRYDVYEFEGSQGDEVSFELRPDTGVADTDHAPELELWDPDGQFIIDGNTAVEPRYGAVSLSARELQKNGTYTLIVTTTDSGDADPYTGTTDTYFDSFGYELRIHEFYGAGEPLTYDSTVTDGFNGGSNFNRSRNGLYDVYEFDGESGETVAVELRPDTNAGVADETHASQLLLYGPDDALVRKADTGTAPNYGAVSLFETLDSTGTFTLIATTSDDADADPYASNADTYFDSFGYELRLHDGYGAPELLSVNSTLERALDDTSNFLRQQNGRYDVFGIDATDVSTVDISMIAAGDPTTQAHAPQLLLYDPTGSVVASESTDTAPNYGAVSLSVDALDQDGVYTLVATTSSSADADPYASTADVYFDSFAYDLQVYDRTGGIDRELTPNESFTSELATDDLYMDEFVGYHDRYAFEADAGDVVSGELRVPVPNEQAGQLRLYGPDGSLTTAETTGQGAVYLDRVEVGQTGTHLLVPTTTDATNASVYDTTVGARTDTPGYEFRFYEFVGDRQLIVDGDTIQTELDSGDNFQTALGGYYEAYVTTATAGDELSVEMVIDQPDSNAAQLILFGPDGSTVTATNVTSGHASIDGRTVETTGEYTIVATTEASSSVYDSTEAGRRATFQYELSFAGPANNPPYLESVTAAPEPAAVGEAVGLSVDASDPNGDALSYEWEQIIGEFPDPEVVIFNPDTEAAWFETPDVDTETQLTFETTVTDGNGGERSQQVTVTVDPTVDPTPGPRDYADGETGLVDTAGLRDAISDWQANGLTTDQLRTVIDAWAQGEPIA